MKLSWLTGAVTLAVILGVQASQLAGTSDAAPGKTTAPVPEAAFGPLPAMPANRPATSAELGYDIQAVTDAINAEVVAKLERDMQRSLGSPRPRSRAN